MLKSKGIITSLQKKILSEVFNLSDARFFYLTGGTALSEFYFQHRKSFDLDLFTTEEKLVIPFSRILEKKLETLCQISVIRRFESFVEFEAVSGNH
ncbi:MAG: nucleotidyl transferase AbiEii/AbiGii toxin family protein [Candidatus Omnitrophica bacterium]|nr:nucleotidyl transferase AbiEii/AbiGii toxin family protein [Candidatus Omnitrophota bacterium]